jgi:hypothetical protein
MAVGVSATFISKMELGLGPLRGEKTIRKMAGIFGKDPDVLLAMADKVAADVKAIIIKQPAYEPCSEHPGSALRPTRVAVWCSRQNFRDIYGWLSRLYADTRILGRAYAIMRADREESGMGEGARTVGHNQRIRAQRPEAPR